MKILYLPIFEPGAHHDTAVANKRGLYNALVKAGHQVFEYDYLARRSNGIYSELEMLATQFRPDLFLSQFHGADVITPAMMQALRALRPEMKAVNWSGDSHRHSLTGPAMIELARCFDWLLIPTMDVLPELADAGVRAAYWNIAYEPPVRPLPDVPAYDIVYLGNAYIPARKQMFEMLRSLDGVSVGIYGDWEQADGQNTYDFAAQHALYKKAKLAIADNSRVDGLNYVSDRPMTIMAAGGALCLHQRVETMKELTGWSGGSHYIEWLDLDDLKAQIRFWLQSEQEADRRKIVERAQRFTICFHSFDERVRVLFELLQPERKAAYSLNILPTQLRKRASGGYEIIPMLMTVHEQYIEDAQLIALYIHYPTHIERREYWKYPYDLGA